MSDTIWVLYCGVLRQQKRKTYEKNLRSHAKMWRDNHERLWARKTFASEVEALEFMTAEAHSNVLAVQASVVSAIKRRTKLEARLAEARSREANNENDHRA